MVEEQISLPARPMPNPVGAWRDYVADRSVKPWQIVESRALLVAWVAEIVLLNVVGNVIGVVFLLALAWYSISRFQRGLLPLMLLMTYILVAVLLDDRGTSRYIVTSLCICIQLPVFGTLFKRVRQLKAEGALASMARRGEPPALLLRAFNDDETDTAEARASMMFGYKTNHQTVEQVLANILSKLGPVVAIGRPGEALPPLGAARFYVSDERWKDAVHELIAEAHSIVMIMGSIPTGPEKSGLAWEIEKIIDEGALDRLILVMPVCGSEEARERWGGYARLIPGGLPPYRGDEIAVAFDEVGPYVTRISRRLWSRPLWGNRGTLLRIAEIRGAFCVTADMSGGLPSSGPVK